MGARREERLESGSWSTTALFASPSASSGAESSSDEGVGGRRAGGSFDPGAMVRVGGGGRRVRPLDFRSGGMTVSASYSSSDSVVVDWILGLAGATDRVGGGGGSLDKDRPLDLRSVIGMGAAISSAISSAWSWSDVGVGGRRAGGGGGSRDKDEDDDEPLVLRSGGIELWWIAYGMELWMGETTISGAATVVGRTGRRGGWSGGGGCWLWLGLGSSDGSGAAVDRRSGKGGGCRESVDAEMGDSVV